MLGLLTACSPRVGVKVQVIDRKTQLESQIAGSYTALQEKAWMIASVRSEEGNKELAKLPPEEREVYRAVQNRKFNADDVKEFLDHGCAGEAKNGLLAERPCGEAARDKAYAARFKKILEQENKDRQAEMKGVILKTPGLADKDLADIEQAMGRKNAEAAASGWWVERADGGWVKKP